MVRLPPPPMPMTAPAGLNNNFHIKVQSYLATLYNDKSILENHHCAEVCAGGGGGGGWLGTGLGDRTDSAQGLFHTVACLQGWTRHVDRPTRWVPPGVVPVVQRRLADMLFNSSFY